MYRMKNLVFEDNLILPKCMYHLKSVNSLEDTCEIPSVEDFNIDIKNQTPSKKMVDLEHRQDQLLLKLDNLYDRIKAISSYCKVETSQQSKNSVKNQINVHNCEEVVLVFSPDRLPWFLNVFLKESSYPINVTWHVHSSVPSEKLPKIEAFVKKMRNISANSRINLRLIFKCVSADAELKLSSLAVPIIGNVNVLRYLSLVYPFAVSYDYEDYKVDSLLDLCHQLERTMEKEREALIKKILTQKEKLETTNKLSIVDLALYNVIKQSRNGTKYVPKKWFEDCERLCL